MPHKSIYFIQIPIFKTNEWMYAFQKWTCTWCEYNLKHLFPFILYTCLQSLITDVCTNWEKGENENSTYSINLFYFILLDFLSNFFFILFLALNFFQNPFIKKIQNQSSFFTIFIWHSKFFFSVFFFFIFLRNWIEHFFHF